MADLIAELADCPFCDGEAWLREETTAPKDCRHYVRCQSCGAETALQPTPEIAAEAWNKRTHHAEISAAVRDAARFAPCLWVPDDDTDSWDTACGNKHQFIAGDAADNLYQHCPYCGGKLIEPNYDTAMRAGEGEG